MWRVGKKIKSSWIGFSLIILAVIIAHVTNFHPQFFNVTLQIAAELSLGRSVDWIKMNHNSIGYYIVNYTEDAWNTFSKLLSDNHLVCVRITFYNSKSFFSFWFHVETISGFERHRQGRFVARCFSFSGNWFELLYSHESNFLSSERKCLSTVGRYCGMVQPDEQIACRNTSA